MRFLYLILFIFSGFDFLDAQITVNTDLSQDTMAIGEEAILTISISIPSGVSILNIDYSAFDSIESEVKTSNIPDSLLITSYAEIEWPRGADFPDRKWPVSQFVKTGNMLQQQLNVRFWDIGVFLLPQLSLELDSTKAVIPVQYLQSPVVYVLPPEGVQPQDTTQSFMPIADIISEEKTWEDYVWLLYLLAVLLTLALVFYMIRRANKPREINEIVVSEIKRPAHIIGLEKLSVLRNKELWQQGRIKEYQSELTYIIREYLENRYGIPALESTTEEIVRDLKKSQNFELHHENNLKEILQIADLVKFAKARPEENVHARFMNQSVDFVEQTKLIISKLEEDGSDE